MCCTCQTDIFFIENLLLYNVGGRSHMDNIIDALILEEDLTNAEVHDIACEHEEVQSATAGAAAGAGAAGGSAAGAVAANI